MSFLGETHEVMCHLKVLLAVGWIIYFTSFVLFMVEAVPLTERKERQTSSNPCVDGCLPGQQVNEECCKSGSRCTESQYCTDCVDGTYSRNVGREAFCDVCATCVANEEILQHCTKEHNAICECMPKFYRSSSQQCLPCSGCNGDSDCKDSCPVPSPSPNVSSSTTTDASVSTITPPTMPVTPTSIGIITLSSSSVFSTEIRQVDPLKKRCIERLECIIPIFITVVIFGILIVAFMICWRRRTRMSRRHVSAIKHTKAVDVQNTNGNGDVSTNGTDIPLEASNNKHPAVNGNGADDARITETDPLMDHQGKHISCPESRQHKGPSQSLRVNIPQRRRSSLQRVPEDGALSSTSSESYILPDWCLLDATIVSTEIISDISGLIGDRVSMIGGLLGFSQGEIENIEHKYQSDLQRQNHELLHMWMGKKGVRATKKKLAKVLVDIGRAQEAAHLWPERELYPVEPSSPLDYFWKRRPSDKTIFKFDTNVLHKKDWALDSNWKELNTNVRETDHGDFKELFAACFILKMQLSQFEPLKNCQSLKVNSHLEVDDYANSLTNSVLQSHTAIRVSVNGNCLFAAASIIAFGSADHCYELRLRTVVELCSEKEYYLKQEALIQCMKAEYELTKMEEDDILDDDAIPAFYEGCVRDTLKEQFSLNGNSIQLFGLASVLGCNIQSVFPAIGATEESPLHVLIPPRNKDIQNPITSYLMWSAHTKLGEEEVFHPNHFVPLLEN